MNDQHRNQLKRAKKAALGKLKSQLAAELAALEALHQQQRDNFTPGGGGDDDDDHLVLAADEPAAPAVAASSAPVDDSAQPPARAGKSRAQKRREKKAADEAQRRAEIDRLNAQLVDPNVAELAAINALLAAHGLRLHPVKADGDCLFSALLHQLEQSGQQQPLAAAGARGLRRLAVQHLRDNRDDYQDFIDGGSVAFDDYCQRMETTSAWGSHLELQALSRQLQLPVRVFTAKNGVTHIGRDDLPADVAPLSLTFHDHYCALGEHYNSVAPLSAAAAPSS